MASLLCDNLCGFDGYSCINASHTAFKWLSQLYGYNWSKRDYSRIPDEYILLICMITPPQTKVYK